MSNPYTFARLNIAPLHDSPHVLKVELARPEKLNAFDSQMWTDLQEFFFAVRLDHSVRAILLCAQGKHFTAGLDLTSTEIMTGGEEEAAIRALRIRETGKRWQASFSNIARCGKPVIACVHGACIGAGVEMISACDVRLCSQGATYAMAEIDVALAADVGGLQRFPKVVGNDSLVRELALSGRMFDAEEALRLGFVSRVLADRTELLEAGSRLADMIAAKSPLALLGAKTLLDYSRDRAPLALKQYQCRATLSGSDCEPHEEMQSILATDPGLLPAPPDSVEEALEYALTWNQALLQTSDMAIAASAKLSKQVPIFKDLPDLRSKL